MNVRVREILQQQGCLLEGEFFFILKSGRVATRYIDIDPLLTKPAALDEVARSMAMSLFCSSVSPFSPHVVAGPATGAIPLVYAVSREHCDVGNKCFDDTSRMDTVFAEKDGDNFILDRLGFKKAVDGKKVWIVEDIATTGKSAKKTAETIEASGGKVVAYSFIWNRDPDKVNTNTMGAPILSLITEPIESYVATEHPMWGIWPVVSDIGHGHPDKFLDYHGPRIKLVS